MQNKNIYYIELPNSNKNALKVHIPPSRLYTPEKLLQYTQEAFNFIYICIGTDTTLWKNKLPTKIRPLTISTKPGLLLQARLNIALRSCIGCYTNISNKIWFADNFHTIHKKRLIPTLIHEIVHFLNNKKCIVKDADLWLSSALETAYFCYKTKQSPLTDIIKEMINEKNISYENAFSFFHYHDGKEKYHTGKLIGEIIGALLILEYPLSTIQAFINNIRTKQSPKHAFAATFNLTIE